MRRTTLAEPSAEGAAAWPTTDGRVLYGRRDDDRFVLWSPGVATFAFARSGPVEYDTVDEDDARRLWTRSALPLAVEARGLPVLHASALSEGDACVVVCGRSTAGKSTLAAVAGKSGLEVESDDAIAFLPRDDGVLARTLPFEVRLRPTAEKAIGPVAFRGDGGRELHLRHVVLLEPDGEATEVEREEISPAEAFASLMPHAYCFSLADSNDRIVDEYTTLVERVPVSRLRYEPRHESLAATVDAVRSVLA